MPVPLDLSDRPVNRKMLYEWVRAFQPNEADPGESFKEALLFRLREDQFWHPRDPPAIPEKDTQVILEKMEESVFFEIAPDGDGRNRIYVIFYSAGTFSIEVSKAELTRLYDQLKKHLGFTKTCTCNTDQGK